MKECKNLDTKPKEKLLSKLVGRGDDLKKEKNLYIMRDYDNNYFYVAKAVSEEKAIDLVSNYTGLGDEVNWVIDLADNEDGKIIQ